jgi:hypothetical protein
LVNLFELYDDARNCQRQREIFQSTNPQNYAKTLVSCTSRLHYRGMPNATNRNFQYL